MRPKKMLGEGCFGRLQLFAADKDWGVWDFAPLVGPGCLL